MHPNRKARASVVLTKFGIEVDSIEECSWTVANAHKWATGTSFERRLGCKTWSELGLACATDWVVQIKLRAVAIAIVLTDRIAIKAHKKKGQTEVIRVELCYTRVKCVWSECG